MGLFGGLRSIVWSRGEFVGRVLRVSVVVPVMLNDILIRESSSSSASPTRPKPAYVGRIMMPCVAAVQSGGACDRVLRETG